MFENVVYIKSLCHVLMVLYTIKIVCCKIHLIHRLVAVHFRMGYKYFTLCYSKSVIRWAKMFLKG